MVNDDEAQQIRRREDLLAVLIVGFDAEDSGYGISVAEPRYIAGLPRVLRRIAQLLENESTRKTP